MPRHPHQYVIVCVFLVILLGYALMALNFPIAYIWATYEDLIGEWSQTYFFLAATVFAASIALEQSRYRWFFVMFALAGLYVVLEEISWGQRIFGFSTPDFLKEHNLQGEANLHNLLTGPYNTPLKDALSYGVAVGLVTYGLVYPLALSLQWQVARLLDSAGLAAPPLTLWPLFLIAAFFELKPLSFNEAEIAELLVAFAVAVTALHYRFSITKRIDPARDAEWIRGDSFDLGTRMICMTVSVIVLAGLTTVAFYSTPVNRAEVDGRIERGMEKFAARYARYDRCDIANGLHLRLLEREPRRVSLLRRIARCYQTMRQYDLYNDYLQRAIQIDLLKYSSEPWRASVNRSLVRSYRLADNPDKADEHLERALAIGYARISEHPDSAEAAYSLGLTLMLANRKNEAAEQFSKAYDMDRSSSKYRRAYFAAT